MLNYLYEIATDKRKGLIPGIIKAFLFILSLIYGLMVRITIFLNRAFQYRLGCKVISVGNITVGGTGKTTLVEFIARELKAQGRKVAVVSRGYKRVSKDRKMEVGVSEPESSSGCQQSGKLKGCQGVSEMGDEAYMLSKKLGDIPVIVDADRRRGINKAITNFGAETVILDDAFQQWKIKKDLEIVTIDATNPFGNKHMLPRGILREPLSSLKRADIFVLTKADFAADTAMLKGLLAKINPRAMIVESSHRACGLYNIDNPKAGLDIEALKGKSVAIFCGIGDPGSFTNTITGLGARIGAQFRFPDHHNYSREELDKIIKSSKENNIDTIITTEKDAVRISNIRLEAGSRNLLVLKIEIKLKDEQGFRNRLLKLYSL
jgi:tetraacyldisaccharide 4'-kinase